MIGIMDYGAGNIGAISRIYKKLNIANIYINKPEDFNKVTKIILPGVGAFDDVMIKLQESGLLNELNHQVLVKKKPILGICVGMQIMGHSSQEGNLDGLGWIDGEVLKFDKDTIERKPFLPHMGWNKISLKDSHELFEDIDFDFGFYFVHSYYFKANKKSNILTTIKYFYYMR